MKRLHWLSKIRQLWAGTAFIVLIVLWNLRDVEDNRQWAYLAAVAIWLLVPFIISWPWWYASKYEIKPQEVVYRRGLIVRRTRTIRRDRIQSVNVEVNILSRILGQAEVVLEAAGSNDSNIQLQFVTKAEAENIRAQLRASSPDAGTETTAEQLQEARELADAPDTQLDSHPAAGPVAAVLKAEGGATSATADALESSPASSTESAVESAAEDTAPAKIPVDTGISDSVFASTGVQTDQDAVVVSAASTRQNLKVLLGYALRYFLYIPIVVIIAIVWTNYALAVLIPLIGTAVVQMDKVMDLRVKVGEKVVLSAGILSNSRQSFSKAKIEKVELKKPWLWRPFGWWEISVSVLGEELMEQRIIASAISWEQAQEVVHQLAGEVDLETKKLHSPTHSWWVSPLDYRQQAVSFYEQFVVVHTGRFGKEIVLAGWQEFQALKELNNPMRQILQLKKLMLCKPTLSANVILPELKERQAAELIDALRAQYLKDAKVAASPEQLHFQ